jgi:hypothetical protein
MTAVPIDVPAARETRPRGFLKAFLVVCAGLAVMGFWIFALFVLLPLVAG